MTIKNRSTGRTGPGSETDSSLLRTARKGSTAPVVPDTALIDGSFAGPRIQVRTGDSGWQSYPLDTPVVRIGRQSDNEVMLTEGYISKRHAEIRTSGDSYLLCDLGSKAGLYVNGEAVTERALEDGDVIRFGLADRPTVVFRCGDAAPPITTTSIMVALESSTGERNLKHLAQFMEFNRLLGGRLTAEEILPNAVEIAMELTGAERGFLIETEPGGGLRYPVARKRSGDKIPPSEIQVSESIVGEVLDEGNPRFITDIPQDLDVQGRESVIALNLRSAVALPLTRFVKAGETGAEDRRETFGVLYLDSRDARETFNPIDQDLLEALARDASSVIENARLLRLEQAQKKLEEELLRAREVQSALIPGSFWCDPHFEAAGSCIPCQHLGGDYVGQFRLPDGRCCLVMADVSGHGLPAALLAAAVQGIMATETSTDQPLATLAERINRALCRIVPEGKYATFFTCALSEDGTLTYVNAGHPPALLLARDGSVKPLSTGDMALGFFDSSRYREGTAALRDGDVVAIYTDGIPEAQNDAGEFFGDAKLNALLAENAGRRAGAIHDSIRGEIEKFSGPETARDDITLLIVKYLGRGRSDEA